MTLKRTVAPTVGAVTLVEAKAHLRVEVADDDALITALIMAASEDCEHRIGRSLTTQTWELTLPAFVDSITLLNGPVLAITSVKYYADSDGTDTTLNALTYTLDGNNEPSTLKPVYGTDWPAARAVGNAVRITYTAGYGAAENDVPKPLKAWVLLRVGALYENRESINVGQPMQAAPRDFADGLLDRYRVYA